MVYEYKHRMDALDKLIADETVELSRLQSAVKSQQIKVDALRLAASARPVREPSIAGTKQKSGGKGKPQGAISQVWRGVFHSIFKRLDRFGYAEISNFYAETTGKGVTMSAIRDRVRRFIEQGYMAGSADSGFSFTPLAIEKFGLEKASPKENGAAKAAPEAGQVSGETLPYPWIKPQPSWDS